MVKLFETARGNSSFEELQRKLLVEQEEREAQLEAKRLKENLKLVPKVLKALSKKEGIEVLETLKSDLTKAEEGEMVHFVSVKTPTIVETKDKETKKVVKVEEVISDALYNVKNNTLIVAVNNKKVRQFLKL